MSFSSNCLPRSVQYTTFVSVFGMKRCAITCAYHIKKKPTIGKTDDAQMSESLLLLTSNG